MRQEHIHVGDRVLTRVGSRLCRCVVERDHGSKAGRYRWTLRNLRTGNLIERGSGAIHPVTGAGTGVEAEDRAKRKPRGPQEPRPGSPLFGTLAELAQRELMKYAAGRAIYCRACGNILDWKETHPEHPSGWIIHTRPDCLNKADAVSIAVEMTRDRATEIQAAGGNRRAAHVRISSLV